MTDYKVPMFEYMRVEKALKLEKAQSDAWMRGGALADMARAALAATTEETP